MIEDELDGIPVKFGDLCLEDNAEEKQDDTKPSNKSSTPASKRTDIGCGRRIAKPKEPVEETNHNTATSNSTRPRKDSHSGNDNDGSTHRLSEVETLKSELQELKQQNEVLRKQAERYERELQVARSESLDMKQAMEMKETELEGVVQHNSHLQYLLGIENIGFDEIRFGKNYNSDRSTTVTVEANFKVTLTKVLTFLQKEYISGDTLVQEHDNSAVAVAEISGKLYAAKCGREQRRPNIFIDKTHWTNQVTWLSEMMIDKPLKWGWAQHAELQLIAFCITQFLEERGFGMEDLKKDEVYQADPDRPFLATIYVSQPVCLDCREFIEKIQEKLEDFGWSFSSINHLSPGHLPGLQISQRTNP